MVSAKPWLNRKLLIDKLPLVLESQSNESLCCDATQPAALFIYISSRPSHSYKLLISHVKPLAIDHQLDREPLPKTRNVDSSHRLLRAANGPLASYLEGVKVAEFSRSKDERKVSFTHVSELCNEPAPSPVHSRIRPSTRVAFPKCKIHLAFCLYVIVAFFALGC